MHSFYDALAVRARAAPHTPALGDTHRTIMYGSLVFVIAQLARSLPRQGKTVAIAGHPGLAWIIADLATTFAGRRVVPLPSFFSEGQSVHVCSDAQVDWILRCDADETTFADPRIPSLELRSDDPFLCERSDIAFDRTSLCYDGGAERVIYTSGTTGAPKGVLHGDRQISAAIAAIASAAEVTAFDIHISALPYSLLLEQISGLYVPLQAGAMTHVDGAAIDASLAGNQLPLAAAFDTFLPTTSVLVPQQLSGLIAAASDGWKPPASFRFVATGGAPLAPDLLEAANRIGLPVRFGYGLSECCSVVSVERPGESRCVSDGVCAVGRPLDGLDISIDDGEIVVAGPTVMKGYLNGPELENPVWRTGDLGEILPDGRLAIHGRRNRVIVLSSGRNVSPEWIEAALLADPLVSTCRVTGHGQSAVHVEIEPAEAARPWFQSACEDEIARQLLSILINFPAYAHPKTAGIVMAGMPPTIDGIRIVSLEGSHAPSRPSPCHANTRRKYQ